MTSQSQLSPDMLKQNLGPGIHAFSIAMIVIPTVAVILRFWARVLSSGKTTTHRLWWDDWVALAALPFSIAFNALCIYAINIGLGEHIEALTLDQIGIISKLVFALYFLYDTGLTLAKSSALLFYARVFGAKHRGWFYWALWAAQVMIYSWWVGIILGTIFMCKPVSKNWLPFEDGQCNDVSQLWIGSAVPSVFLDLVILLLPLPMLWKLQMSTSRKYLIIGIFICGYCIIVISLGRLITVLKSKSRLESDLTYAGIPALYWLACETPMAILSICLPSMSFLVKRAMQNGFTSLFSAGSQYSVWKHSAHHPARTNAEGALGSGTRGSGEELKSIDSRRKIFAGPQETEYAVHADRTTETVSYELSQRDKGIRVKSDVVVASRQG